MFEHGMSWSQMLRYKELCVAYLFIYNLFIREIHNPFSKKSEDDLYVTG